MTTVLALRYLAPLGALAVAAALLILAPTPGATSSAELAEVGLAFIKAGQPTRGLAVLEQALAQSPQDYRSNFIAAAYYIQTKQFEKANPYLKSALTVRQDDPELLFSVGAACQGQEQYEDAANWYMRARAIAPRDPKIAYNLAMLHIRVMSYPKAKTFLEEYLRLAPDAADRAYVVDKIRQLNEQIGAKHG